MSERVLYEMTGLVEPEERRCTRVPLRTNCDLAHGHEGPCWNGPVQDWLGFSPRCGDREGACFRAKGHRGDHEDVRGKTWRKRRAKQEVQS